MFITELSISSYCIYVQEESVNSNADKKEVNGNFYVQMFISILE